MPAALDGELRFAVAVEAGNSAERLVWTGQPALCAMGEQISIDQAKGSQQRRVGQSGDP